jgi:hypothetical protein
MSRAQIVGAIRTALDAESSQAARRASVADRLAHPLAHPRPGRTRLAPSELLQQFKDYQRTLGVDLIEVGTAAEVPAAIAGYLLGLALPLLCHRCTRSDLLFRKVLQWFDGVRHCEGGWRSR